MVFMRDSTCMSGQVVVEVGGKEERDRKGKDFGKINLEVFPPHNGHPRNSNLHQVSCCFMEYFY